MHLNYGFDTNKLCGRRREQPVEGAASPFVFGFIGRMVPGKGLELLLDGFAHAVGEAQSNVLLKLWGPGKKLYVDGLKERVENDRRAAGSAVSPTLFA